MKVSDIGVYLLWCALDLRNLCIRSAHSETEQKHWLKS